MSPASERSLRIWLPLPEIWTRTLGAGCTSARPRGSSTFSVTSKLVVTGCCSCTATYSISARNSAAPLIGQLRVISCNRLLFILQPTDQHLVDGILPVCRSDDAFHDDAIAIDQVTLRYPECVVGLPDLATGIVENVERETQGVPTPGSRSEVAIPPDGMRRRPHSLPRSENPSPGASCTAFPSTAFQHDTED